LQVQVYEYGVGHCRDFTVGTHTHTHTVHVLNLVLNLMLLIASNLNLNFRTEVMSIGYNFPYPSDINLATAVGANRFRTTTQYIDFDTANILKNGTPNISKNGTPRTLKRYLDQGRYQGRYLYEYVLILQVLALLKYVP
jgi:hypothetical protein